MTQKPHYNATVYKGQPTPLSLALRSLPYEHKLQNVVVYEIKHCCWQNRTDEELILLRGRFISSMHDIHHLSTLMRSSCRRF